MNELDFARNELMSAVNDLHDDESSESKYNDVGQYLQMNDKKWCEENLAKNRFATADNVFTFIKGEVENRTKRRANRYPGHHMA